MFSLLLRLLFQFLGDSLAATGPFYFENFIRVFGRNCKSSNVTATSARFPTRQQCDYLCTSVRVMNVTAVLERRYEPPVSVDYTCSADAHWISSTARLFRK